MKNLKAHIPFANISDMVASWPQHKPLDRSDEPEDRHIKYEFTAALRWHREVREFLPADQPIISNYRITKLLRHAAVESGPMNRDGMYFVFEDRSWIYASYRHEQTKECWEGRCD